MGVGLRGEPILTVKLDGPRAIGEALIQALTASIDGTPHPDLTREGRAPDSVARLAGFRSYRVLMETGTQSVTARLEDDVLTLTPMRNAGPRNGYQELLDKRGSAAPRDARKTVGQAGRIGNDVGRCTSASNREVELGALGGHVPA